MKIGYRRGPTQWSRMERAYRRQWRADKKEIGKHGRRVISRNAKAVLHRVINRRVPHWEPWRAVKNRELDGYIAQVTELRYPCGCGNPRCSLFEPTYMPFPGYPDSVRDAFLEKHLHQYYHR